MLGFAYALDMLQLTHIMHKIFPNDPKINALYSKRFQSIHVPEKKGRSFDLKQFEGIVIEAGKIRII